MIRPKKVSKLGPPSHGRLACAAPIIMALALCPQWAMAAWPVNGAALSTALGNQFHPVITSDGSGGAIVAWYEDTAGNFDVRAQRVNADGTIAAGWPVNGVAICTAPGDQFEVVVTTDGAGGAIVAWEDKRSDATGDIYAQRVTAAGTIAAGWPANGVALAVLPGAQVIPTIVSDGAGGAIVAWEDDRSGPNTDIYAQRVNGAGAVLWTPNGVAITTAVSSQYNQRMVTDGANGAIVGWWDTRSGPINAFAQRVDAVGMTLWTPNGVQLCSAPGDQQRLEMAADGAGGAIAVWDDDRSGGFDIYGQRVNSAGGLLWGATGAKVCTAGGDQSGPTLATDGSGGAIFAWTDSRGVDDDIYAQRLNGSGAPQWVLNGVPVCTAPTQQNAQLTVSDGLGGAILAWSDGRGSVFAQHLTPTGLAVLPVNGLAVCPGLSSMARDGGSGAIITWSDDRAGATNLDIYAQRLFGYGAPILEPGFPVALSSGAISPPGICELDGLMPSEIVFGDAAGNIQAYHHDGTVLAGWPQNIGGIPDDSPVCVGDLEGDGRNEVVCGSTDGRVYAFRANGTLLPGWPVVLGTNAPAYCSIGNLTGTSYRQIVALSGNKVFVLLPSGATAPGFPLTAVGPFLASAAIGDVDADGHEDIVVLQQSGYMDVIRSNGTVQAFRNLVALGKTFSHAPTLADLKLDGKLEIVAPTDQGDVYVMNPDGTDYAGGWPYHDPTGSPITSVALAQIRGTFEPELVFGVDDFTSTPLVHAFYQNKVELGGYPRATGFGWHLFGMPIIDVTDNGSPDVLIGSRDSQGYAWDNFGSDVPGWPATLSAQCNVSPATGDIDADGRLEAVFTTFSPAELIVFDLGGNVFRDQNNLKWWWPMYGYNAERQGCLACGLGDRVLAVDPSPAVANELEFSPPRPNPTSGSTTLSFVIPKASTVQLTVFDLQGRLVREIFSGSLEPGRHDYTWDGHRSEGTPAGTGLYYVRLETRGEDGTHSATRKVTLMR